MFWINEGLASFFESGPLGLPFTDTDVGAEGAREIFCRRNVFHFNQCEEGKDRHKNVKSQIINKFRKKRHIPHKI